MEAAIAAHGLRKRFGSFDAVQGIDLVVKHGEVLGFLGPNGAGKSTTMRMITGFLAPTSGSVRICGTDMLAEPLKAAIRDAFLGMRDPEVLRAFRVEAFAPVTDAAYDVRRETARVLELDLGQMRG